MYFLTSTVLIGQLYPPQPITSPHHHVTASPRHRVTALIICLAPCHQASQSFALPPATKPVSHLPWPLPPRHRISQSFALPPATKPVSHLPCPLPPNQSVICLAPTTASPCHRVTASPCHRDTTSPHHRITVPPCHRITASDFPHHMGMNLIG